MADKKNLRDHGLASSGEPSGTPTWVKAEPIGGHDPECPNCGAWLCDVQVPMKNPLLKGGEGTARYLGCPACPWASPAMTTAKGTS
jgi:hypothetical protein